MDQQTFIDKANLKHQWKYSYDNVKYIKGSVPVDIICHQHGVFIQKPECHLGGRGCPKCGRINRIAKRTGSFEGFLDRARKTHGNKYQYNESSYVAISKKLDILCPDHGWFSQNAARHISGNGCKSCAYIRIGNICRTSIEEFIEKSVKANGAIYDYSKVEYTNNKTDVIVICSIHGEFRVTPSSHTNGVGCQKCSHINQGLSSRLDTNEFVARARKTHGDKYDYSLCSYELSNVPVEIVRKSHGPFMQIPSNHLTGAKCPACANRVSKQEINMKEYIESLGIEVIPQKKSILSDARFELDLFIPIYNLAIEHHGIYWHSTKDWSDTTFREKHINKFNMCESSSIELISIFENKYNTNPSLIHDILYYKLNANKLKQVSSFYVEKATKEDTESFIDGFFIGLSVSESIVQFKINCEGAIICVFTLNDNNIISVYNKPEYSFISILKAIESYMYKEYNLFDITICVDNTVPYTKYLLGNGFIQTKMIKPRCHILYSAMKSSTSKSHLPQDDYTSELNQGARFLWDCGSSEFTLMR